MKNKTLFYFFFLLILISSVISQPPFQANPTTQGLIIIYPQTESYNYHELVEIDFHVANINGSLLLNTDFDCNIHTFAQNGSHILKTSLSDAGIYDESIIINNTIFDYGFNPIIVWCNSTTGLTGFFSGGFYVTNTGKKDDTAGSKWLVIVLALIGMTFMTGYISSKINDKGLKPVKITFFVLTVINGLLLGFVAWMISINPYDSGSFQGLGLAYASINVFLILGFVFNYFFLMFYRIYESGKNRWVNSFKKRGRD